MSETNDNPSIKENPNQEIIPNTNNEVSKEVENDTDNNINNYHRIINEEDDDSSNKELITLLYSEMDVKRRKNLSQESKRRNKTLNLDNINSKNKKKKEKLWKTIKTIEDDKDYKQLKVDIDKGMNFVDYFLIIGVEPEEFFNDKIYDTELEELKEKLKPKIISYFPKYEKKTIAFDDSIISHCFPNGFDIIKSNRMPKTKIFSFILDNNYFNLNYPQKYLSCLICYESINKYKTLYEEYKKLSNNVNINNEESQPIKEKRNRSQKKNMNIRMKTEKSLAALNLDFLETLNNLNMSNDTYYTQLSNQAERIFIPKCLMFMSLYPLFSEYEKFLFKIYRYSMNIIKESNELSPKEMDLSAEIQARQPRAQTITHPIKQRPKKKASPMYANIAIPMDKIIENVCIEFPTPPRGVFNIQYSLISKEKNEFNQSLMNALPLIEVNLKKIFITFDIKTIIEIYLCLFLETRILFFSKDIEVLNIFIYGFLSFLFPFEYQYQVVTILPKENYAIIESITPFIAGINQSYQEDFFEKRSMILSDAILVVDIDEERTEFINKENEIPDFPKKMKNNLEKNLQNCLNNFMKEEIKKKLLKKKSMNKKKNNNTNNKSNNSEMKTNDSSLESKNNQFENSLNISEDKIDMMTGGDDEDDIGDNENSIIYNPYSNFNINPKFNKEIHEIFFNFNASLLNNYSKYLNLGFYAMNEAPRLEILFKVDNFLNDVSHSDKNFYDKFITETQLFGSFIYMRMIPKNSREKIQILTFDEQINKIYPNKSQKNIFLNSREYDFCNIYSVQKPRKITKEEKEFYSDVEKRKELLNYGIIIEQKKGNIFFNYPIFPKLTTDIFFPNYFREYFVPANLNENIEAINEDIISKSHLGGVKTKQDDMINYIYLSWMQMWAMTFWYMDEQEKKYWFQELVRIIEKTTSHEMEIYNLLFETLSIYGKDYMVLKLYDILLKLHLNPSFKVHNIAMQILDKKKTKMEKNLNNQLQRNSQKDLEIRYKNLNFRSRTFKSKYYGKILSENITIYAFDTCMNCQNNINLESLSLNFKDMNRELMWAKCPSCHEYILPKITIQYGTEINRCGKIKVNTSHNDCVVLFSPYFLRVNCNNSLLKNYGIKLDVEELMFRYNGIFWNSIWYFKLNNLNFDFMLPYQQYLDKSIFDKNLNITTFDLQKDIANHNNKIKYADEEGDDEGEDEDNKYHSDELQIVKFDFVIK